MEKTNVVRLVLGDQLNINHSWFEKSDRKVLYLIAELKQETDYVRHHIQKVVAFFLSMRHFAEELKSKGHRVQYYYLDDTEHPGDLEAVILKTMKDSGAERFEYLLPDEYRLDQQLKEFINDNDLDSACFDTEHFLVKRGMLAEFFKGKKQYLLESFYRHMRKKFGWLVDDADDPEGGQWNFDKENRKKIPIDLEVPQPKVFKKDVETLVEMINSMGVETIGNIDSRKFIWPVSRQESLELLEYFCKNLLPQFGKYQDALHPEEWSLFHSRLSFSLNVKMLSPREVIERAIHEYRNNGSSIDIAQLEGFIRQIAGWREYMRGIYWAHMPEYSDLNHLGHDRELPAWFWTGKTKMSCVGHAIHQSLDYAYAHHIQRLMITGNFALLAGIDPTDLDEWYLGIYIDAIEWVEITNTRGMSQFADGGIVGTKPYVSSANYIKKMGHYCKDCYYDPNKKTGERSCPFNSLYWHFYERHREKLEKNPRIGMMYRTLDRMDGEKRKELRQQAEKYLSDISSI